MKEELILPLRPRIRRLARALGISAAIYSFLRLTFIGELISSALAKRPRTENFDPSTTKPIEEPLLDSE
ncbi:MAG TPA: hypothetical protein VFD13_04435 [Candidatus Kapabacteria bacterium]|nr:hypothetical protein [Candidatus Kapabacteria bacterium]